MWDILLPITTCRFSLERSLRISQSVFRRCLSLTWEPMPTMLRAMRADGRSAAQLRSIKITPNFSKYAEGSVLIECGNTQVICAVSVENRVPSFLTESDKGWVTAEYAMLPRSTHTRCGRNPGGRGKEIQRLIGRSLRAAVDMKQLGERTLTVDCDVIQADGGTRTAAITGGWAAMALAIKKIGLPASVLRHQIAAVSCGVFSGEARLDLAYEEDSQADVDCNFVMTADGRFIEVQGTAEAAPFTMDEYSEMVRLAQSGAKKLMEFQRTAIDNASAL